MNLLNRSFSLLLAFAAIGVLASAASAAEVKHTHCKTCGKEAECRKICKVVDDVKEVPVVCWSEKCEDFCKPGPCVQGCKHCEPRCEDGKKGGKGCACAPNECPKGHGLHENEFCYRDTQATCGKVYNRKMLMKKIVIKKVPTQRLVVEYVCGKCDVKGKGDAPGHHLPGIPRPPRLDARYQYPHGGYVAAPPTIILYAPNLAGGEQVQGQPIQIPAVQVQPGQPIPAGQIPAVQLQPGQIQAVQIPPAQFPPVEAHPTAYAPGSTSQR